MTVTTTPDSEHKGLMGLLPAALRPYALLARFDRPIGWWLLFWPGAWAIALAGRETGQGGLANWPLILWFLLGSIAMRGAGCVYNDIVDRDLDRQVARTAARPLASGQVSLKSAWIWLLALCGIGLIVLLQLNGMAQIVALASLTLVAAYPFMKRITWWPQIWLGLVFSWAAPVGWTAVTGGFSGAQAALYLGSLFWVVGYDTIYALQDREDDALVGIRSSALRLGAKVRGGVATFYALALIGWGVSIWLMRPDWLALLALLPAALHLGWQVLNLKADDGGDALAKFRSNRFLGLLVFAAMIVVATA